MAKELVEVCRDYCQEVWIEAFNLARFLVTSKWRKAENICYSPEIRAAPVALPPPTALVPTLSDQPSTTQVSFPPYEVSKWPSKADDQGQGMEVAKGKGAGQGGSRFEDKGKGKAVKLLRKTKSLEVALKPKDAVLKAKDVAPKAKEAETRSKEADSKAIDPSTFQLGSKEDPPPAKA